jgi:transcription termination factor Rho|tara:strand:- start:63 stop:437 length:375 start_codon:yes stop_codon:yes gene_type:complete
MAEEYNSFLKKSLDLKSVREERNKDMSRDKLFKTAKKKIQTTMIGSLSTLESGFGFLWGIEIEDEDRTPEQKKLYEIYEEARAQILDRGNTQIRNLESEFVNYEIVRKKHYINLPVQTGDKNDG